RCCMWYTSLWIICNSQVAQREHEDGKQYCEDHRISDILSNVIFLPLQTNQLQHERSTSPLSFTKSSSKVSVFLPMDNTSTSFSDRALESWLVDASGS